MHVSFVSTWKFKSKHKQKKTKHKIMCGMTHGWITLWIILPRSFLKSLIVWSDFQFGFHFRKAAYLAVFFGKDLLAVLPTDFQGKFTYACIFPVICIGMLRLELSLYNWVRNLLSSSNFMTFHDFFNDLFKYFQDLRFSCHFPKFSKFSLFWGIFWP